MGVGPSRNRTPSAPAVPYGPPVTTIPPYNIARPPPTAGLNPSRLNSQDQRQLEQAYLTIQRLQNQGAMQQPLLPLQPSQPPMMMPPAPFPGSSTGGYPPPSPILQRLAGPSSFPSGPMNSSGIRDNDYAAIANISGLNPADVALLHREYVNVTRSGSHRLDRVVFRQLLREAMIEANNENIDRAIENIFVTVDRNHDGFIDFPEFVGAFRDILKGPQSEQSNYLVQQAIPNLINEQYRVTNANPMYAPVTLVQQPAPMVCTSPTPIVF